MQHVLSAYTPPETGDRATRPSLGTVPTPRWAEKQEWLSMAALQEDVAPLGALRRR